MRLLAAELLKIWTAPRTLLGIVLAQTALVVFGVITLMYSALQDPALPELLARDVVSNAADLPALRRSDRGS